MGPFKDIFQNAADKTRLGLVTGMAFAPYAVFFAMGGPAAAMAGVALMGGALLSMCAHATDTPHMDQPRLKAGQYVDQDEATFYQNQLDRTVEQFNELKSEMGQDRAILRLGTEAMATAGDVVLIGRQEVLHYTPAEMEFVLAHELSHLKHKDTSKFLTVTSVVAGFAMLPLQIGAAIFTPVSLLAVGMAAANIGVQMWAKNMTSQVIEDRADRTALSVTRDFKGAQDWMKKELADDMNTSATRQWRKQLIHHHSVGNIRLSRAKRAAKTLGLNPS